MTSIQTTGLDPEFGTHGRVDIRTPGNFFNELTRVTKDTSGRLLIYGSYARAAEGAASRAGVGRLQDNGEFDSRFGDMQDGLSVAPKNTTASIASGMALLSNGSFFMTGATNARLPLIHYDQNGKHLADWNLGGGTLSSSPRLLATHDDKLFVASRDSYGGVLYRRNADGSADTGFGDNGKTAFLADHSFVSTLHMARSLDTPHCYLAGELDNDGFILRIKTNGEPDTGFADSGLYRIAAPAGSVRSCRRVLELDDGNVLALISGSRFESGSVFVIRLNHMGQIDSSFNSGEPLTVAGEIGEDLTAQPDGKFLVTHRGQVTGQQLSRYLPDGALDEGFGSGGSITFNNHEFNFIKGVTVQPDGKVVVAGAFGSITSLFRLIA